MTPHRRRRQPISCEPCRARKIKCPRDSIPCSTCRKRGVCLTDCVYANGQTPAQGLDNYSPRSSMQIEHGGLAARIERIEHMLHPQIQLSRPQAAFTTPSSLSDDSVPRSLIEPSHLTGYLQKLDSGHVRFVPRPSRSTTGSTSTNTFIGTQTASIEVPDKNFPFSLVEEGRTQDILSRLPPPRFCTELKDVYFRSFASIFHILHDPKFEQNYAAFEKSPESQSLSWLALLFAILGTAVTALDAGSSLLLELSRRLTVTSRIEDLSTRYRSAAMLCLEADQYLWRHNLTTLQALIVLIYGIGHSHGPSWTMLGLAYNIALSIGCHIDPSIFNLDAVESEERRRSWAGLMMLYTSQNTAGGNIGPRHMRLISNVQPPADVNDEDITSSKQWTYDRSLRPTQMSYILFKFRLYEIGSEICDKIIFSLEPGPDTATIRAFEEAISAQCKTWNARYIVTGEDEYLPSYHIAHLHILTGAAHQLILLLHRSSISDSGSASKLAEHAYARCLSSAEHLLEIHETFYTTSDLRPYQWYLRGLASFHAFHAAVVLVAIMPNIGEESEFLRLKTKLNHSLRRFESLTAVSKICMKATPILRQLLIMIEQHEQHWSPRPQPHPSNLQLQSHPQSSFHPASTLPTNLPSTTITPFPIPNAIDAIFTQFDTEQWLAPSSMVWDQWDNIFPDNV